MQSGPRQALPIHDSPQTGPSPLVAVVSPQELQRRELDAARQKEAENTLPAGVDSGLLAHIRRKWQQAKDAKRRIEQEMLEDMRQRNSEYDPEDEAILKAQGAPIIYMRLTAIKAKAAVAWLSDIIFQGDDHPWSLKPTPIPELTEDLVKQIAERAVLDAMQLLTQMPQPIPPAAIQMHATRIRAQVEQAIEDQAKEKAIAMTRLIADQFVQSAFYDTLQTFLEDLVTFPMAIIKSPVIRNTSELKWQRTPEGFVPVKQRKITTSALRVSPFDIYVTDQTVSFQDGPVFERMRLSRASLEECVGVDGFREDQIRIILDRHYARGRGAWQATDSERGRQEYRDNVTSTENDQIEIIEGWDSVSGKMLLEAGVDMDSQGPIDPLKQYEICIWFQESGTEIPYIVMNDHPLGMRPYSGDSYERIPGSFWGRSLCRTMRDKQAICNAAARSLVRNMEITSGPQVFIDDVNRIPADEKVTEMYPWKIWQFHNDRQSTNEPLKFFQPASNAQELFGIYEKYAAEIDNDTGIPAYTYGSDEASGAGRTLGGLSILSNNAARGLRLVMSHVDKVIRDVVERQYHHNMLFHDDDSVKGDLEVVTRGAMAVVQLDQIQQRRLQYLQVSNNPTDLMIIGLRERAAVWRELAKTLQMPIDEVAPTAEMVEQRLLAQQQQAALQATSEDQPGGTPAGKKEEKPK